MLTVPSTVNFIVVTAPGEVTCAISTFGSAVPAIVLDTNTSTSSTKLQSPLDVIVRLSDFSVTLPIGPVSIALICWLMSRLSGIGNSTASGPGRGEPGIICAAIGCVMSKSVAPQPATTTRMARRTSELVAAEIAVSIRGLGPRLAVDVVLDADRRGIV